MSIPILFTIPNFITAGSGRAMLNIIERLDRDRFAPAVGVLRKGGTLDRVVEEELGIPLLEIPWKIPVKPYYSLLNRAWQAARPLRTHRFILWHSFHYGDDYTEAIIARMAGAYAWIYTKKNMNWYQRSWYVRTMLASRIAVQNSDMMDQFFDAPFFRKKRRLVPRGVVTDTFSLDIPPRLGLRAGLDISSDAVVVGCVANLMKRKGHSTLLEAIALVPEIHLLVAGKPMEPEYAALLNEQVQALSLSGRVHYLGHVPDIPAFLSEVDIFVLPTWGKWGMEGSPVALLEAMACGKACVATSIPGSKDIIEHDKNGLLVPPEVPGALAEAVQALAGSPQQRQVFGSAARERILHHFSIDLEVVRHVALYEELLKNYRDTSSAPIQPGL